MTVSACSGGSSVSNSQSLWLFWFQHECASDLVLHTHIRIDKAMYLRGSALGLSWDSGTVMQQVDTNVWSLQLPFETSDFGKKFVAFFRSFTLHTGSGNLKVCVRIYSVCMWPVYVFLSLSLCVCFRK